jgi:hypothetical protein
VTVTGFVRDIAMGVAWVAIALLIALGAAGIVTTMNRVPATAARAELTWAGDTEIEPALEAATVDLEALASGVDELSSTARRALSAVVAGDASGLQAAIAAGTGQLGDVQGQAASLRAALAGVPHAGNDWALSISADLRHRYEELAGTSDLAVGLEGHWAAFTGRSLDAARLAGLLTRHDTETAAAAQLGTAGSYKAAIAALDTPEATIAEARALRDRLAGTSDVSTLTAWLDRNADYDAALRRLYVALDKSGARVTAEVKQAFAEEKLARGQLPGDTRGLVVIMSDIAQGGLNQAVIAIEEARGSLSEALDVQQQLRDGAATAPPD